MVKCRLGSHQDEEIRVKLVVLDALKKRVARIGVS